MTNSKNGVSADMMHKMCGPRTRAMYEADLAPRQGADEEIACPWCGRGISDTICGERHAQLAAEAALAPHLHAYAIGAVLEKERLRDAAAPGNPGPDWGKCRSNDAHHEHDWLNARNETRRCPGMGLFPCKDGVSRTDAEIRALSAEPVCGHGSLVPHNMYVSATEYKRCPGPARQL